VGGWVRMRSFGKGGGGFKEDLDKFIGRYLSGI